MGVSCRRPALKSQIWGQIHSILSCPQSEPSSNPNDGAPQRSSTSNNSSRCDSAISRQSSDAYACTGEHRFEGEFTLRLTAMDSGEREVGIGALKRKEYVGLPWILGSISGEPSTPARRIGGRPSSLASRCPRRSRPQYQYRHNAAFPGCSGRAAELGPGSISHRVLLRTRQCAQCVARARPHQRSDRKARP